MTAKKTNSRGASLTTNKDAGASNVTDKAQGETQSGPLRMGKTYEGTIIDGDNKSLVYTVNVGGKKIKGCYWVAGVATGLLGINTHIIPTRGTRVMIVYGNPSYIFHGLPSDPKDTVSGGRREMHQTTGGEGRKSLDNPENSSFAGANAHRTPPKDLFEGEYDLENNLGVGLRLLHSMAALSGGERAKIEAFVVNDMVRIISDTYKQISAFGDMQIYNDGRLNVKFDGTSYEHEAWSLFDEDSAKAEVDEFQISEEEDIVKSGRWRFSQYIGWLGEFVHQFVTEPSATASSIAEAAYRPGKSRFQQMSDGSILLQSVADISIERVCRVQVPIELKRWDDPEGVTTKAFKSLQSNFLRIWQFKTENMHHAAYQLREYSRWLSCFHSYARFHQLAAKAGEWEVPLETAEGVTPSWTNQEKDVERANSELTVLYWDTYSCMRLMRDGSIVLWDGYGNGVTLGKSGIQFSSTTHIEFDAAGDIRGTAGGDIIFKARRNVEIVAVVGGLILKSCTWFKGLCEKGILWLKSDADDPVVDDTTDNPRGDTSADYPEIEKLEYAVLIESSKGKLGLRSERTLNITAEGTPDDAADAADVTGSIVLQSRLQDVRAYARRDMLLKSEGTNQGVIALEATRAVLVDSPKFLVSAYLFDVRYTSNPAVAKPAAMTFRGGKLNVPQLSSKFVGASERLAGPERGPQPNGTPPPGCCLPSHFNHVDIVDDLDAPEFADADELAPRLDYENDTTRNPLPYTPVFATNPSWSFPEPSDYKLYNEAASEYPRQEPLAQQRIQFDSELTDITEEWLWNTLDVLQTAPRTNISNLPYPGRAVQELFHPPSAGDALHLPLEGEYSEQNNQTALRQRQPKRRYLKRDNNE
jgi:hypothetical protein